MSLRAQRRTRTSIAALLAIPFVVPFLFLIGTALRTRKDYLADPGGIPHAFTLDNLVDAWTKADLGRALGNTLIVCLVACLVCTTVSLAGAFWFRIHEGRVAAGVKWLLVSAYAIPMIAWLIPVFVMLADGGATDNLAVAGIVNGVSSLPFTVYLTHTFFRQVLTAELIEAARIDGAGLWRIFRSMAVPLALPVIASVVALVFVWTFGDLLVSATLLQGDPSVYTLPLAATTLSTREDVNLQGQAAAALVALLPTLVVFAVAQKALAKGFGGVSDK